MAMVIVRKRCALFLFGTFYASIALFPFSFAYGQLEYTPTAVPDFNAPNNGGPNYGAPSYGGPMPGAQPMNGPGAAGPVLNGPGYGGPAQPPSPAAGQPSGPLPGTQPIVADIRIIGNRAVREDKIYGRIKTRKDREFDPEQLKADVRKLMSSGLFKTVNTKTQQTPTGIVVILEISERPLIEEVRFIGNRGLSDSKLMKETGLKKGEPLNQFNVDEGRRRIEEFYRSRGYVNAQVTIMEGKGPTDRKVVYDVAEGNLVCIAKVEFVGNTIATDGRLQTQITSKPGFFGFIPLFRGKLNQQKLEEDEEKLLAYYRSLGFFQARLGREVKLDKSGDFATLTFVVDEGVRYVVRNVSVSGNVVFHNDDLLGKMELSSGNFFNQAKMNRDVESLRDIYGGQGYIFSNIKADPVFLEEPGQLDLVYEIEEGEQFRAGKINVEIAGEYPHTRDSVLLNRISVTPGEIIDIREIRASERRIKSAQILEDEQNGGTAPKIVVRPPEIGSVNGIATKQKPRTSRGQSPDSYRRDSYR